MLYMLSIYAESDKKMENFPSCSRFFENFWVFLKVASRPSDVFPIIKNTGKGALKQFIGTWKTCLSIEIRKKILDFFFIFQSYRDCRFGSSRSTWTPFLVQTRIFGPGINYTIPTDAHFSSECQMKVQSYEFLPLLHQLTLKVHPEYSQRCKLG